MLIVSNETVASDAGDEFDNLLTLSLEELLNTPITTASFYTETDLEAASTVSVITAKYWQERGARRLDDALSYMPGVAILPTFVGTRHWVIRGYPNSNATGVQTLWDGVPLNSYPTGSAQADHPNIQLNTLSSIEVIRGPGSALYGSDALQGVVSLKAYESMEDENIGRLRAASNGYYEASVNSSFEFAGDWRANIALSTNGQPDQGQEYTYLNLGVEEIAERDYNYANTTTSLKFSSDPSKTLSYKFGVYYNDYEHDGFYHNGSDVPANDNSAADSTLGIFKAEASYTFSKDRSLSFDISYLQYDREFARFLPNTNIIHIFAEEDKTTARFIYKDTKLFENTDLSVALEHKDDEVESASRQLFTPAGSEIFNLPLNFSDKERKINSILLDGKSRFSENKNIFRYSFRYDDYSDFGNQFTPRAGFIHFLNDTDVIKLLYGNSFRAPAGNEIFGAPLFAGDLDLKPEELDTLELIYISKNETWKAEAIIFASEWTNGIILIDTDNNGSPDQFANASDNEAAGIELSLNKQFEHWLLDVNGSYIKSQNKDSNVDYTVFPTYIFNLALAYQFHNNWVITMNNRVMLDMTRVQDTGLNSPEDLPNYWRADLNLTKNYSESMRIFMNIRNLFNRDNELPSIQDSPRSGDFTTGIEEEEISLDVGLSFLF